MSVIDRERWRRLGALLDQAMDLSLEEQVEWLRDLAVTSPDIAADLGAMLSGESVANRTGFLAEPLQMRMADLALNQYAVEHLLGQGGMGTVWLARSLDGRFSEPVAIKILNIALLTENGRERFRREGAVLARLSHPGIARLLEVGVSDNGQPYLALEYVDGQPIDLFVKTRGLDQRQRIELFLQVLAAVAHAHANRVVHRDLKPHNILVTAHGLVKLLDFGIAKELGPDGTAALPGLTVDGARALTPEYAAPEQVRGELITAATDVYALGVLLYVLVSGRHPTAEGTRNPAEAVDRLLGQMPAPLGIEGLDGILARALEKAAGQRYQTVVDFGDDLGRYLRHEPVAARDGSIISRARLFLRRSRGEGTSLPARDEPRR